MSLEEEIHEELPLNIRRELDIELADYRGIYRQINLTDAPPPYVISLLNNALEEQPDPDLRTLTVFRERNEIT